MSGWIQASMQQNTIIKVQTQKLNVWFKYDISRVQTQNVNVGFKCVKHSSFWGRKEVIHPAMNQPCQATEAHCQLCNLHLLHYFLVPRDYTARYEPKM